VIVVLDIGRSGPARRLGHAVRQRAAPTVLHRSPRSARALPPGPRLVAPEATATAELVFICERAGLAPQSRKRTALYVGILTATGGFRFRTRRRGGAARGRALLERGVDPEGIYESV